jgi:hypothetical protein
VLTAIRRSTALCSMDAHSLRQHASHLQLLSRCCRLDPFYSAFLPSGAWDSVDRVTEVTQVGTFSLTWCAGVCGLRAI